MLPRSVQAEWRTAMARGYACPRNSNDDLCGPLTPTSFGGSRYFLTVLEDATRYSWVSFLKTKDEACECLQHLINIIQVNHDTKVRVVRTDGGGEFCNKELKLYFAERGIIHQVTAPYSPQSNGAAERLNRTLVEKVRALLAESGVPKEFWGECLNTVNVVRNASPVSGKDKTPHELLTGKAPDVSHFRVFGCAAYAHIPKSKRRKLDPVSAKGVFVGYHSHSKCYRVLDMNKTTIRISRDVVFVETAFPFKSSAPPGSEEVPCLGEPTVEIKLEPSEPRLEPVNPVEEGMAEGGGEHQSPEDDIPPLEPVTDDEEEEREEQVVQAQPELVRRSSRVRRPPSEWWGTAAAAVELQPEPLTAREALGGPEAEQWRLAMQEEYDALLHNRTWDVMRKPSGAHVLPVKWIFKRKRDAAGNIERYKARLVVVGSRQREGIDYDEVYSPVGKHSTLRTLLAVVAARDLELHQLDVANAFLNGTLEEEIWVQQPPGFEGEGREFACRLRKTLYGLKQSPRAWYSNLRGHLENLGFTATEADAGLFVMKTGSSWTYVLLHVDDILIAGPLEGVNIVKSMLSGVFKVKDLGESSFYLGMDIARNRKEGALVLSQRRYVSDLLDKYLGADVKPKGTPLPPGCKLTKAGTPLDQTGCSYSEVIGSLMYLAVCTRPDISQAVGALARYMACPTEEHMRAAKHVLGYIAGTKECGLCFGGDGTLQLQGFADADYAGDTDNRRSTTAFVFVLGGAAVSWQSRLQPTVAMSTTESEYMAASAAVKEGLWFRKLLPVFGIAAGPVPIFGDNQAALKLLKNPISCSRTKHIDTMHHFARERVAREEVAFHYIPTDHMVADVLTKALPRTKFEQCRLGLGVK
jgi:hypothetical protein